jgi:hypothetical protein
VSLHVIIIMRPGNIFRGSNTNTTTKPNQNSRYFGITSMSAFLTRPVLEHAMSMPASAAPSDMAKIVPTRACSRYAGLICHAARMLYCVGCIQTFTNLLCTFPISSLNPANGYLTPIGVDGAHREPVRAVRSGRVRKEGNRSYSWLGGEKLALSPGVAFPGRPYRRLELARSFALLSPQMQPPARPQSSGGGCAR